MSNFVFVTESAEVWDMGEDGSWVSADGESELTLNQLLMLHNGVVYEAVADLAKLPKPEPKKFGYVYKTDNAMYIRFTEDSELPDPWICTRTGVRFSWRHIQ